MNRSTFITTFPFRSFAASSSVVAATKTTARVVKKSFIVVYLYLIHANQTRPTNQPPRRFPCPIQFIPLPSTHNMKRRRTTTRTLLNCYSRPPRRQTYMLRIHVPCTYTRHFYCAVKRSKRKNSIDHRIHDIISFVLFIPQEIPVIHQLLRSMEMDRRRRRLGFDRAQFKHAVEVDQHWARGALVGPLWVERMICFCNQLSSSPVISFSVLRW